MVRSDVTTGDFHCRWKIASHNIYVYINRYSIMNKGICLVLMCGWLTEASAQMVLNLDSCRALALRNNKELRISQQKKAEAHYEHKAATTNFLPKINATGAYIRNQREVSLLNDEQKTALSSLGTTLTQPVQNALQQLVTQHPEVQSYVASLSSFDLASPLNAAGSSIVDVLRTDTRNIYAGVITLTQPVFMGGKIRAYNKLTGFAEQLAESQHQTKMQEVILSTDEAYWQVVSLAHKKHLAESFVELVQKLDTDMEKMIAEGVVTKADGLSVKVKVNEAEMTFTKVDNGLSLCKMLLCQLCGLPLNTDLQLADEQTESLPTLLQTEQTYSVETAIDNRPEIQSLKLATDIYKQKVNITRAEFLPTVALMGNYMVTNPALWNGFERKFRGSWNVGVMVTLPIFHWGEGSYKVKAAQASALAASLQLDEVKEKVELQVNQCNFKVREAAKRLSMAEKNLEKADENLRCANLGFREGVMQTSNVLEAQTAWLSAQSEKIDAQIDVKLSDVYLKKSMGLLK